MTYTELISGVALGVFFAQMAVAAVNIVLDKVILWRRKRAVHEYWKAQVKANAEAITANDSNAV